MSTRRTREERVGARRSTGSTTSPATSPRHMTASASPSSPTVPSGTDSSTSSTACRSKTSSTPTSTGRKAGSTPMADDTERGLAELHLHLYGTIRPRHLLEYIVDREVAWE